MSKFIYFTLLLIAFLIICAPLGVRAQNASQDIADEQTDRPARPNLLRELDLTPAQIQQIRRINKERRQVTQESKQRLTAANQALDEAIYSNASENEIQSRQKEVQAAHADFVRNRTINEQSIKQVLTPQQFERFRSLQTQYNQTLRQNKNRNPGGQQNTFNNRPNKPLTLRQQMRQNRLERREKRQQKLNRQNQ